MIKRIARSRLISVLLLLLVTIAVSGCGASGQGAPPGEDRAPQSEASTPSTAGGSEPAAAGSADATAGQGPTAPSTQPPAPTALQTPPPATATTSAAPTLPSGTLTVHYIDVGQGDATLLQGPDFTILIDAGRHDRSDVVPYLKRVGVTELDLVIGTHPHADHIGQMAQVIQEFTVHEVWLSGDTHTSRTFERTLDAILSSDAAYHEPRAGEVFTFGSARVEVLNPDRLTGDLHEGSISVRVVYGSVAFVFTGDAESQTEQAMIRRGHDLRAQILQLGHHGSRTSSTAAFLRVVSPEVAIYSAGSGNSYGHPHAEVIDRLAGMNIPVYGTDVNGTIQVVTDGQTYELQLVKQGQARAPPAEQPPTQPAPPPAPAPVPPPPPPAPTDGCAPGQVDINTASIDDLKRIQHINDTRAAELVRLRPFRSVDDLTRINGIAAARLRDIKEQGLACVGR